jgi:hypothetical protein
LDELDLDELDIDLEDFDFDDADDLEALAQLFGELFAPPPPPPRVQN